MNDKLLHRLLAAPDDAALQALISAHDLDIETVEGLKAHSARFYYDRPAEAVRVAGVARRLGDLLPDPAPALGRWTLANASLFTDHYREAVELFEQAGELYRAAGRRLEVARMGVGHIGALAYIGRFAEALALAAENEPLLASAAQNDPDDLKRLGLLFNNVGITYELMGRYEEALDAYDHQVAIARELGNALELAHVQHNRACALTYLNAFDEALATFREAEQEFIAAGATADLARLTINRGMLYAFWSCYTDAQSSLEEADRHLAAMEGMDQQRHALAVYQGLAHLQSGAPVDPALRNTFAQAQAALTAHGPPFEEGLAWLGLGRCHLALEEWEAARVAFERARALAAGGAGRPLAYLALHGLGNLAEAQGRQEKAVTAYENAIGQIEAIRQDLQVEAFRASFLGDKLIVYQDLVLLHVRQGRLEDAFATVERAKSRLLAERLTSRLQDEILALAGSDDPHIRALARQLRTVLSQLEELYGGMRLDDVGGRGETWLPVTAPHTLIAVERLEGEALGLTRQIERDAPLISPLVTGHIASFQSVQTRLRNALFLQYHIARGRVWAFVVDGAGIRAYHDLASLAEVEMAQRRFSAAVERVLGLATSYGQETLTRYLPSLLADTDAQLAGLYDLLIHPLADHLLPGAALVISPDGLLHHVPFHALLDDRGNGAVPSHSYLIERHTVSYIPSATVLDLCARQVPTGRGTLVVGYGGDRLEQIAAEVTALTRLLPEADLLSEARATTERLLSDAPRYRLLHLATHARFRADNVMLSSLSLADRRLTLAEIARLRLGADLVALSGCETGRGRLHGADLISLACGFLGAGARSLLVSLWRVDDATTAQLMTTFYHALHAGEGRAAALRAAQLELLTLGREKPLKHGAYRHPAYWASFVLIGEWGRLSDLPGRTHDA